jgi:outer membrane protein OmpA-like peptidoglycan-associated protein
MLKKFIKTIFVISVASNTACSSYGDAEKPVLNPQVSGKHVIGKMSEFNRFNVEQVNPFKHQEYNKPYYVICKSQPSGAYTCARPTQKTIIRTKGIRGANSEFSYRLYKNVNEAYEKKDNESNTGLKNSAETYEPVPGEQSKVEPNPESLDYKGAKPQQVFFQFGSDALGKEQLARLKDMKANLMAAKKIWVVGFTDSIGSKKFNDVLALRRANTVKNILASHGIDKQKIIIKGQGKCCYAKKNSSYHKRLYNRRVEVFVERENYLARLSMLGRNTPQQL